MDKVEAQRHMQRCIDSGLWVADAKAAGLTPADKLLEEELHQRAADKEGGNVEGNEVYEDVD